MINFWVVSGGMLSLYDWAPELVRSRKEILWTYGGTPKADAPAASIRNRTPQGMVMGRNGLRPLADHISWPGSVVRVHRRRDGIGLPGYTLRDRRAHPSIRLKLQRNMVQDLNLLEAAKNRVDKAEVTRRFNKTNPNDWWTRNSPLLKTPPQDWNNADIGDAAR